MIVFHHSFNHFPEQAFFPLRAHRHEISPFRGMSYHFSRIERL